MLNENLETLTREISDLLIDSIVLSETLENTEELNFKNGIIAMMIKKNIKKAFENIENCRKIISASD